MELLSPAGNIKHVDLAINKKVDAVYGGLKEWNARNKAMNFSIQEYNSIVKKLHNNHIKFYLTLNTLVFDEEIEEIINFLKDEGTVLPDSFIVVDIGLIIRLQKEFPQIPLHFSTQFGVHNIEDCKFAESLGTKRVILARELTFKEIDKIKSNTNLEVECFCWGSQCISFSGLCFFGSLINCGNGNRGKCIITCRDTYQVNDMKGNLLYVPDLNCTQMIPNLEKTQIDCLKLEGRRRSNEELSLIIDEIKNKEYSLEQNGYIYGYNVEDNKLFEKINRRMKLICKVNELDSISPYDIFIEYNNDSPKEFRNADSLSLANKDKTYYVFSELKKAFKYDKANISIDLYINEGIVKKVMYINSNGEGKIRESSSDDNLTNFEIEQLAKDISNVSEEINLYKIKYIRNKENKYRIDKKLYEEIINIVKDDKSNRSIKKEIKNEHFIVKDLIVETDKIDYAITLKDIPSIKVIYNISTISNMKRIDDIMNKLGENIIYKLPIFNFTSDSLIEYFEKLVNKEVMFTRPSQVYETRNISFKKRLTDYTIYVWNKETLRFLKNYGVSEFTASPELSYEKNRLIFDQEKMQYIICGKLPLVYTRQCFKNVFKCNECSKEKNEVKKIKNIDKKLNFHIICNDDYRVLLAQEGLLNNFKYFDNCDEISYRYITANEGINEIIETINIFSEENYFEKLKTKDLWKNSYEGNILKSRC